MNQNATPPRSDTSDLTLLGAGPLEPTRQLETFPGRPGAVTFRTTELTAVCPKTRQRDFYRCEISYKSTDRFLESKSLKLYLASWTDEAIFAEHLAVELATDLAAAVGVPVQVTLVQNVRGGLELEVSVVGQPTPALPS